METATCGCTLVRQTGLARALKNGMGIILYDDAYNKIPLLTQAAISDEYYTAFDGYTYSEETACFTVQNLAIYRKKDTMGTSRKAVVKPINPDRACGQPGSEIKIKRGTRTDGAEETEQTEEKGGIYAGGILTVIAIVGILASLSLLR